VSGRGDPRDLAAALYRAIDDEHRPWLDELLIRAGLDGRGPQPVMASVEQRCDRRRDGDDIPDDLDDPSVVVFDGKMPGWRARLVHDLDAGEPYGDALAPALLVPARGRPRLATQVYVPAQPGRIVAAWQQLADLDRFGRYLRICHGATATATACGADLDVVVFDTADFRQHAGISAPADLSGEKAEWRAWLDGDVFGVVLEQRDDITARRWRQVDAVWGLFGHGYAAAYARELLHQHAAG
jgi:hypothetical protein